MLLSQLPYIPSSPTKRFFLSSPNSDLFSSLFLSLSVTLTEQEKKNRRKIMEDKSIPFESSHSEPNTDNNHGWQKVTYVKKQKKKQQKLSDSGKLIANGSAVTGADNVFKSLEKQSDERRKRIAAQTASMYAVGAAPVRSALKHRSDDEDEDSDAEGAVGGAENGVVGEKKKEKVKKPKKPKVTVAEAAVKIDAADLAAFLADITVSYESQQEIQLMRFADYFGRAFAAVAGSQFPWLKLFRESPISKIADVPVSHLPEPVYKTSVDWINQRSFEALGSFVLWGLDSILVDLAAQLAGSKGFKKSGQQTSSKSQVAKGKAEKGNPEKKGKRKRFN
ncbi:hypothetical protein HAX54_026287 [Datura stramonium]|uniref:Uncharacterized protein n=1 Tax=Datura stramonium TaxID=4076 RepID=A0ABS8Y6Y7_DATST|nr:hypothetical protein [Datura stramonium]